MYLGYVISQAPQQLISCYQLGCQTCTIAQPDSCVLCNSNLMKHDIYGCIIPFLCPEKKYKNLITNSCQDCPAECKFCSKPNSTLICDECIPATNLWIQDLAGVFTCQMPCTSPSQWHK